MGRNVPNVLFTMGISWDGTYQTFFFNRGLFRFRTYHLFFFTQGRGTWQRTKCFFYCRITRTKCSFYAPRTLEKHVLNVLFPWNGTYQMFFLGGIPPGKSVPFVLFPWDSGGKGRTKRSFSSENLEMERTKRSFLPGKTRERSYQTFFLAGKTLEKDVLNVLF